MFLKTFGKHTNNLLVARMRLSKEQIEENQRYLNRDVQERDEEDEEEEEASTSIFAERIKQRTPTVFNTIDSGDTQQSHNLRAP